MGFLLGISTLSLRPPGSQIGNTSVIRDITQCMQPLENTDEDTVN